MRNKKRLRIRPFPDPHTVGVSTGFLTQNGMSVISHAAGNIADRFTLVKDDREDLAWLHGLQFQLGLDEVVRANDPTQIQLLVCLGGGGNGLAFTGAGHLGAGPL